MTDFTAVQACFDGHALYSKLAEQEATGGTPSKALYRVWVELADAYLKRAGALVR